MAIAFTICSNNYLAQATVLGNSLKQHMPGVKFFTILVDELAETIDYTQLPFTCIPVRDIEPEIDALMDKYNIIELNTCVKPQIFNYFFSNYGDKQVTYFDPDIRVYEPLTEFDERFAEYDILLTPHIFTPIPIDGKLPTENTFLNYGIYNLGFIALQRSAEVLRLVDWWKERTYKVGYDQPCKGIFVDQLYINLVPQLFKGVYVLNDYGYNMAPWNLHERYLSFEDGKYTVSNKDSLKFFHFSNFRIDTGELPLHYYNRFTMAQRPDMQQLYTDYNDALNAAGFKFYTTVKCVYYEQYKIKQAQRLKQQKKEAWKKKNLLQKLLLLAEDPWPLRAAKKMRRQILDRSKNSKN